MERGGSHALNPYSRDSGDAVRDSRAADRDRRLRRRDDPVRRSPAAAGPTVTVRIEGAKRTLLAATAVHTTRGWLTRGGAPKGACSAASAAGALRSRPRGRWSGSWESKYGDYFVTRILGDTEGGKTSYWDLLVNNVAASTGACGVKLRNGDHLVFAAVPEQRDGRSRSRSAQLGTPTVNRPLQVKVSLQRQGKAAAAGRGDRHRREARDGGGVADRADQGDDERAGHCDAQRDHQPGGIVLGASKTGDVRARGGRRIRDCVTNDAPPCAVAARRPCGGGGARRLRLRIGPGPGTKNATVVVTRDFGSLDRSARTRRGRFRARRPSCRCWSTTSASRPPTAVASSSRSTATRAALGETDWFFYVNGIEAPKGAAATSVNEGDHIWWDLHDWQVTDSIPAVVGSYPGAVHSTAAAASASRPLSTCAVRRDAACNPVAGRSRTRGVPFADQYLGGGSGSDSLTIVVGTWAQLKGVSPPI